MENEITYQIIDSVDSSIYWKDASGKYLGCNKYMADMAGRDRSQIIGKTDYLLPWKSHADTIREVDLLVMSNREKLEIEEVTTTAEGNKRTFLSIKNPLFDNNNEVIGIIGVSIDISHHKKLESEFEKTENALDENLHVKNRFLQNISHESRIPLGSVLSISESLVENWDKFDDKVKFDNTKLIFEETSRLSKFVLDTFDTSSFLKDGVVLNLRKLNFSDFLKDTINKYQRYYFDAKISIKFKPFNDYSFSFDPILMSRVIENLMMNAIRYSPKKKNITVELHKTYLKNTEIPAIHCCITDEGLGIPEQELEHVFNPFTESSRTASKACGVGLGLSICKEIIEAHSGEIWVKNNSLKPGVTFNFVIPTNLFPLSDIGSAQTNETIEHSQKNIIQCSLKDFFSNNDKKKGDFALVGISPFNSYFSVERILEICEWINRRYNDFALFVPDEISQYTFEALGYEKTKIGRKIKKQDNYTINKAQRALYQFYKKNKSKNVKIYTFSELKQNKPYKDIYTLYSQMFVTNKIFRNNCLKVVEWVLSNNLQESELIDDFQKNLAVQYLLFELPIMINTTNILNITSCDFVYHSIPQYLRHLYSNNELVSNKQRFVILKE